MSRRSTGRFFSFVHRSSSSSRSDPSRSRRSRHSHRSPLPPSCTKTRVLRLARSITKALRPRGARTSNTERDLHPILDHLLSSYHLEDARDDDGSFSTISTPAAALVSEAVPLALSRLRDPDSAIAFFAWARSRRCHHILDSVSYSALLLLLARSLRFREIDLVLDDMRDEDMDPTPQAFGALIAAFSRSAMLDRAMHFYSAARDLDVTFPDASDCNSLLLLLLGCRRFDDARQVYGEMLSRQGEADNRTTCIMVGGLCAEGKVDEAVELIHHRWGAGCIPNVVFYNTLMDGYCSNGDVCRAYRLFKEMKMKAFLPTLVSYGILINGFCKHGNNLADIKHLLSETRARGLDLNVYIYNTLIDACFKWGMPLEAKAVLKQMLVGSEPDTVTYNTLISGFCRNGKLHEAEHLLRQLLQKGLVPNKLSYTPLVHSYCQQGDVLNASNFLIEMMEQGIPPDLVTYGVIVHGLVTAGEVKEALIVRENMMERGLLPDAAIYNVLINGLCKKGMLPTAKLLLSEMLDHNIHPDEFVYVTLIDGFVRNGDLGEARKLFQFMDDKSICPGVVGYNAMVKGFCRFGLMNEAVSCVSKMRKNGLSRDEFTYTTLIDGYVKNGDMNSALGLLTDMLKRGNKPNVVTYTALVNGFCRLGDFDMAEKLLADMRCCGLYPNVVTYSILIGNFCKAGNVEKASAYFEDMLRNNCFPNDATFHYLTNGMTKSLLTEGTGIRGKDTSIILDIFWNMVSDKWDATTASYNAIIGCLCKHRMLKLALDLRDKMARKGYPLSSVTFVCLLHGLCIEGRSEEWKVILSCEFDRNEFESAQKYTILLDQHLYQGQFSEASRIFQSLLKQYKPELELNCQEPAALEC